MSLDESHSGRCSCCGSALGGRLLCPECLTLAAAEPAGAPQAAPKTSLPAKEGVVAKRPDEGVAFEPKNPHPATLEVERSRNAVLRNGAGAKLPKGTGEDTASGTSRRRRSPRFGFKGAPRGSRREREFSIAFRAGKEAKGGRGNASTATIIAHLLALVMALFITLRSDIVQEHTGVALATSHEMPGMPELGDARSGDKEESFDTPRIPWPEDLPDIEIPAETPMIIEETDDGERPNDVTPRVTHFDDSSSRAPRGAQALRSRRRVPGPAGAGDKGKADGAADLPDEFVNRRGDARLRALKDFGGGPEVLGAVEKALAFLSRHQLADGSWNADGKRYPAGKEGFSNPAGFQNADIGVTGLALLAFMGAGYTTNDGAYAAVVRKGLDWLIRQQTGDGSFSHDGKSAARGVHDGVRAYNSAIATLALSEAIILHPRATGRYFGAARKGVGYFVRFQGEAGGWTYDSGRPNTEERADTSISGWVVLALHVAEEAGISVNARCNERLNALFTAMSDHETGETIYADAEPWAGRRGIGMVGVGLVSRRLLDPARFAPTDRKAAELLLEDRPEWRKFSGRTKRRGGAQNFHSMYGWYYGTLGMFMATGGRGGRWQAWNESLLGALLPNQIDGVGVDGGSWSPDETWLGPYYGRLYSTTMACLTLEVYFRYKPSAERLLYSAEESGGSAAVDEAETTPDASVPGASLRKE